MSNIPACPQCAQENTYQDGDNYVCADCGHEFPQVAAAAEEDNRIVRDSNGTVLQDGDSVVLIKDLKVKGSSTSIKVGTKVRNIRLVNGADGHDIDAKVDGFGSMMLKSSVVKKVL